MFRTLEASLFKDLAAVDRDSKAVSEVGGETPRHRVEKPLGRLRGRNARQQKLLRLTAMGMEPTDDRLPVTVLRSEQRAGKALKKGWMAVRSHNREVKAREALERAYIYNRYTGEYDYVGTGPKPPVQRIDRVICTHSKRVQEVGEITNSRLHCVPCTNEQAQSFGGKALYKVQWLCGTCASTPKQVARPNLDICLKRTEGYPPRPADAWDVDKFGHDWGRHERRIQ